MASRQRRDPKKGRHRARFSPETIAWEREHLIPEQPGYLDASTYVGLVAMRNRLELDALPCGHPGRPVDVKVTTIVERA